MTLNVHESTPVTAEPAGTVTHLAIREFEPGSGTPLRTIRIPVKVFSIAARLVPARIREEMAKEGFDLDGILQAARDIHSPTTLAEIEEHKTGKKTVVALE
ncbi:MAG TPA: hypothetical protein VKB51_18170 [bacterium]|nr:hypothetical protein [bacterium]